MFINNNIILIKMEKFKHKCLCGCGQELNEYDTKGRKHYYILGHNNKGKSNWWKIKDVVKKRSSHERANKICKKEKCFINNEQCSKKLEIAHIDGNFLNNSYDNLVCLCPSHHRLMDNRKLSLKELFKIRPFTISSGKRRYK